MINTKFELNSVELNYNSDSRDETYKFRTYDSQIKEMFEPEGKFIIYLTLLFLLGLVTTIIFVAFF
jgi:hypothetical protein